MDEGGFLRAELAQRLKLKDIILGVANEAAT
jgi:hypothetical protein